MVRVAEVVVEEEDDDIEEEAAVWAEIVREVDVMESLEKQLLEKELPVVVVAKAKEVDLRKMAARILSVIARAPSVLARLVLAPTRWRLRPHLQYLFRGVHPQTPPRPPALSSAATASRRLPV